MQAGDVSTVSMESRRLLLSSLRVVAIQSACRDAGIEPTPVRVVHAIAYFADALAPVWGLPPVDARVLKQDEAPFIPELQIVIDRLVGRAVLKVSNVCHILVDGEWRLDANYALNALFGNRIVDAMLADREYSREISFIREVVLALAGLGESGMENAVSLDATYADPNLDVGGVVDFADEERESRTSRVVRRFGELAGSHLSSAESVHLYIRHLYTLQRGRA